jgi:hypothetical protein
MSAIYNTPWKHIDTWEHDLKIFDATGHIIATAQSGSIADMKHIVRCVNEYDNLVAEVERLKEQTTEYGCVNCSSASMQRIRHNYRSINRSLKERAEKTEAEVERLKDESYYHGLYKTALVDLNMALKEKERIKDIAETTIEKLTDMLRKLTPSEGYYESIYMCVFCGETLLDKHKPNCDYVRLSRKD